MSGVGLCVQAWQSSGRITFVLPDPTSEKWRHSSAVMILRRKAFCAAVGTIW